MKFVGGATLIEAWYQAYDTDPDNVSIKQSLEIGIEVMEFVKDTPMEVLLYLKNILNTLHAGSEFTVLEICPM